MLILTDSPSLRWLWTVIGTAVILALLLLASAPHHRNLPPPKLYGALPHDIRVKPTTVAPINSTIYNATLGFQDIFVINIASRSDARDALTLAAAASGLQFKWIEGVLGAELSDKGLPFQPSDLGPGAKGCWRAHMNALQRIVEEGISSALIMEDDADWDIRIRDQLHDFSLASRALTQPLFRHQEDNTTTLPPLEEDLSFSSLPTTITPTNSPYGDDWDVLWLGHCGVRRPSHRGGALETISERVRTNAVIQHDDATIPTMNQVHEMTDSWYLWDLKMQPEHTRLVHFPVDTSCTGAYAISQRGARRMLYEGGVQIPLNAIDMELRGFCQNEHAADEHICLAPQPALFSQFRAKGDVGKDSNINEHEGGEVREVAFSHNIRWSTRLNLLELLRGGTDFEDQWPDSVQHEEGGEDADESAGGDGWSGDEEGVHDVVDSEKEEEGGEVYDDKEEAEAKQEENVGEEKEEQEGD